MRALSYDEILLVSGGYGSSQPQVGGGADPGGDGGGTPTDPWASETITAMTEDDARYFKALLSTAVGYEVLERAAVAEVAQSTNWGSTWSGGGDVWANHQYSNWIPNSYHSSDSNVTSSLSAAGVNYHIQSNGSIYVPGMGYAVASGFGSVLAGTAAGSSVSIASGSSDQSINIGQADNNVGDIIVTGHGNGYSYVSAGPILKFVFDTVLGYGIEKGLDHILSTPDDMPEDEKKAKILAAEQHQALTFNPTNAVSASFDMRDGAGKLSGWVQDHKFYVDYNHNGIPDTVYANGPNGIVADYGGGFKMNAGNPFLGTPRF